MKNIHEVIRSKEQQLQQIQRELEVLRAAAKLLAEESDSAPRPASSSSVAAPSATPAMVMRPAPPAAPAAASKEGGTYVAPSAWDVTKPQFP